MKHLIITTSIAAILFTACNNENKTGQTETIPVKDSVKDEAKVAPPLNQPLDSAAMMKAWEDFAKPGDMHKWLAKFNGTWEADITEYSNPAKPAKSTGVAVYSSSLNGLYQEGKISGTMMGMPFEGKSWMGYDNSKKEFVSTWIDNMGSGIIYMKGSYDVASKKLTLKGVQTDPGTGKDSEIREVMTVKDDNNYIMEMYGTGPGGKEIKFMDAVYKRKK